MGSGRFEEMWSSVVSIVIFAFLVTSFFIIARIYLHDENAEVSNAYRKEAVTQYPDNLDSEEKDYILGASLLAEILSYPEGTYIKVNGTTISSLTESVTGLDYVSYAKKYGTELIENYISIGGRYKKEVALDSDGEVTGASYTLIY